MKRLENIGKNNLFYLSLIILLGSLELGIDILNIPNYILPKPTKVIEALYTQREILFRHTIITLFEAILGLGISVILVLSVGSIIYPFKSIKKVLYPYLLISQTIPLIAVAPIILIWFGFGILPKVMIVVLICTFPMLLSFLEGLDNVDKEMIELFKIMGGKKKYIFLKVILPSSLPSFFSGLKIAATYAIMGAVIGEWLGAKSGLGIYMTRAISSFKTENLFASIIVVIILSLGIFKAVEILERKVMPWKRG